MIHILSVALGTYEPTNVVLTAFTSSEEAQKCKRQCEEVEQTASNFRKLWNKYGCPEKFTRPKLAEAYEKYVNLCNKYQMTPVKQDILCCDEDAYFHIKSIELDVLPKSYGY